MAFTEQKMRFLTVWNLKISGLTIDFTKMINFTFKRYPFYLIRLPDFCDLINT